jgi:hypothetical protein
MWKKYVVILAWVCRILLILPCIFLTIGFIYSVNGFLKDDPASPSLFEGILKIAFVILCLCSNRLVLNKVNSNLLIAVSCLVGFGLAYCLLFNGDWNLGSNVSGWITVIVICGLLPLSLFLHDYLRKK